MWSRYNPSPSGRNVGDCAVRAVSKALDIDWQSAYALIASRGYEMNDMPSSNSVIWSVLRQHGFKGCTRPDHCPDCYSVKDFCAMNPEGTFVIFTSGHVVCAADGNYFDSWDSGNEIVLCVWYKDQTPNF